MSLGGPCEKVFNVNSKILIFFFLSICFFLGVRVSSLLSLLTNKDPSPKSVNSTVTSSNSNIAETDEDTSLKKEAGIVKSSGSEKVLMIILHSQNRILSESYRETSASFNHF